MLARPILSCIEALGFSVSLKRTADGTEAAAVSQDDGQTYRVQVTGEPNEAIAEYRAVCYLAESLGIEVVEE